MGVPEISGSLRYWQCRSCTSLGHFLLLKQQLRLSPKQIQTLRQMQIPGIHMAMVLAIDTVDTDIMDMQLIDHTMVDMDTGEERRGMPMLTQRPMLRPMLRQMLIPGIHMAMVLAIDT